MQPQVSTVWALTARKKLIKAIHDLSALGWRACAPNSSQLTPPYFCAIFSVIISRPSTTAVQEIIRQPLIDF